MVLARLEGNRFSALASSHLGETPSLLFNQMASER